MFRTAAFAILVLAAPAWTQSAISARSGMIHHLEGDASLAGERLVMKPLQFPEVKEGEVLATQGGRAEVLLNPGVFLRLDRNSSFKMISNRLADTHVEVERGSALMEVVELVKENQVTIHVGDATVRPLKTGLYLIDAEAREMRVFDGQALASLGDSSQKLGRGKMASLTPALTAAKFDRKKTGMLYDWSSYRSGVIAQANMNMAATLGQSYGRPSRGVGMWAWYPTLGMFTYLPGYGRIHNPFGWYYYSPLFAWGYYHPVYFPQNNGYDAASGAPAWTGRGASASPSAPAAVAASTGAVVRSAPVAAPAAPSAGGPRSR